MGLSDILSLFFMLLVPGLIIAGFILNVFFPYESTVESSQAAIERINEMRAEKLMWSETLYEIAKIRVDDMLKDGYCEHYDPNGENDIDGLFPKYGINGGWEALACNAADEDSAIDQFLDSPPHRFIILETGEYGAIYCKQGICVFLTT